MAGLFTKVNWSTDGSVSGCCGWILDDTGIKIWTIWRLRIYHSQSILLLAADRGMTIGSAVVPIIDHNMRAQNIYLSNQCFIYWLAVVVLF